METPLRDVIRPGTRRGLDFVIIDELRKRTGVSPDAVLRFALSEMLCNALDKDATEISVDIQFDEPFNRLEVSDNGNKKLSLKEIQMILDFESKASSKRGFLMVSRGYLGNALKCIFGYSYALAELRGLVPPDIIIKSGEFECHITLKPDRINEVIKSEIKTISRQDDGWTTFIVKFPTDEWTTSGRPPSNPSVLEDLIFATSMVNPTRKITYNIFNTEKGTLGSEEGDGPIRKGTSVLWYNEKQFQALFEDFLRARPETQLKEFIPLFRGFTSKKIIREILQELTSMNHDSKANDPVQFFPAIPISDLSEKTISKVFAIMKARSKPIARNKRGIASLLGCVGQESLRKLQERYGWKRLRYVMMPSIQTECPDYHNPHGPCANLDHVEFPYLVELAVFDRQDDGEGLKIYQCVNFMASTLDIFARIFSIQYRLGRVGITQQTPVTVVVHLVCPVLKWLNYGKSGLDENRTIPYSGSIGSVMEKAFDKILPIPKTPRVYRPPPPPKPMTWVPHGKLGDPLYEQRLIDFANEILAIDSQRTHPVKYSSRGWCYLLEGLGKIHKGEFNATQKAINDCRKIGLLPIDFVAEDQDVTRRFMGIHVASEPSFFLKQLKKDTEQMLTNLPTYTTDYWADEKYYVMICVEKGDLLNLFKPICDEYHVPIISSKGWPPILLRGHIANLSRKAQENGLKPVLLLFYDHDPAGLKITKTFRKNLRDCERGTDWSPDDLIIERFGLNKEDIDKYNLTWIENLKTGSGRESHDYDYIRQFGKRKCESNALFKNDETLRAGEEICRKAIEKYYGKNARERFKKKEESSKQKLQNVYDDPIWDDFNERIDALINSLPTKEKKEKQTSKPVVKEELEVTLDNKFYGRCPRCGRSFDYDDHDVGRLVRCRRCSLPMRLRLKEAEAL